MSCKSKTISLPQLPAQGPAGDGPKVKRSKASKWRMIVLIGVHVLIAAHIIQWQITGRTLSPIEPSESMQTLELGLVNAGAIFFALALLTTAIFGRFICGWACHVVALQDACYWMLRKIGLRPRPFRSRLLMLVPLGLACYMFLWPTVSREILIPLAEATNVGWPDVLRQPPPLAGFQSELVVEDFWATFPEWYVAIPFLFIIGFAIVYFLGAKGFCTYGCPYGGFFAPVEAVSPVRIRVTDACEGCGHCTSACTSNVRVHEEVRDYGMVVDPGCMRCLDCVSVCPNDALYLGLGRPAVLAPKPKDEAQAISRKKGKAARGRRFDLTWPEELAAAALWLATFVSLRGFLDATPLLMAAGLASICTYLAWKAWGLIRSEHVRIHGWILKNKGRFRPSAALFVLVIIGGAATTAWSGATRYMRWSGLRARAAIQIPVDVALRSEYEAAPADKAMAEEALRHFELADSPEYDGLGWSLTADLLVDKAYLQTALSRYAEAAETLERVVEVGNPTDDLVMQLGQLQGRAGIDPSRTEAAFQKSLDLHPNLHGVREQLAIAAASRGDTEAVARLWSEAPSDGAVDASRWLAEARFRLNMGDAESAGSLARTALSRIETSIAESHSRPDPEGLGALLATAQIFTAISDLAAIEKIEGVIVQSYGNSIMGRLAAARFAGIRENLGLMTERLREVEPMAMEEDGASSLFEIAKLWLAVGQVNEGLRVLGLAREAAAGDAWSLTAIAGFYGQIAQQTGSLEHAGTAIEMNEDAVALEPNSVVLRHDLAVSLLSVGRVEEAAEQLRFAAETSSTNAILPERLSQIYQGTGRPEEAKWWADEAARRRGTP